MNKCNPIFSEYRQHLVYWPCFQVISPLVFQECINAQRTDNMRFFYPFDSQIVKDLKSITHFKDRPVFRCDIERHLGLTKGKRTSLNSQDKQLSKRLEALFEQAQGKISENLRAIWQEMDAHENASKLSLGNK